MEMSRQSARDFILMMDTLAFLETTQIDILL